MKSGLNDFSIESPSVLDIDDDLTGEPTVGRRKIDKSTSDTGANGTFG